MKRPPTYLLKEGRQFWSKTLKEFDLVEAHDLERLEHACHCLDRLAEARAEVDKEGPYFVDRFGQPKEHPSLKVERDNKVLFIRIIRELRLDLDQPEEHPRPPRQY